MRFLSVLLVTLMICPLLLAGEPPRDYKSGPNPGYEWYPENYPRSTEWGGDIDYSVEPDPDSLKPGWLRLDHGLWAKKPTVNVSLCEDFNWTEWKVFEGGEIRTAASSYFASFLDGYLLIPEGTKTIAIRTERTWSALRCTTRSKGSQRKLAMATRGDHMHELLRVDGEFHLKSMERKHGRWVKMHMSWDPDRRGAGPGGRTFRHYHQFPVQPDRTYVKIDLILISGGTAGQSRDRLVSNGNLLWALNNGPFKPIPLENMFHIPRQNPQIKSVDGDGADTSREENDDAPRRTRPKVNIIRVR